MKPLTIFTEVIGVVFVILAGLYLFTPAHSLPSFLPGFDPNLDKIHYKHGVGSLVVGVALLAYAWSASRKKG